MQNTLAKSQVCSTNGFLRKVRIKFAMQTLNLQRQFPKLAPRHQKLCKNKEQERFSILALFVFVGFGQLAFLQVVSSAVELGQQFHTTVFPTCKFCSNSTPCLQRSTCKIQQCARATWFSTQKLPLPSFNKR